MLVINLKADTGLVDRSENTTRYYKDIKDYPTFTKEQEVEWFTKLAEARENVAKAKASKNREKILLAEKEYMDIRDYIACCNQRLVISAAKNYSSTETLTDYINEANFGLFEALDRYDVTNGAKFASYAMWFILRAINKYKYCIDPAVKKTNYYKTFHVVAKARNKFMQENERMPTSEELLDAINDKYKKDIKDKYDLLDIHYASIDTDTDSEEASYAYGDIDAFNTSTASYNDYEDQQKTDFDKELITTLLDVLTPRERTIIEMRFGLYNDESGINRQLELKEISERLNITSERVRQIARDSIKKMKDEYKQRMGKLL